MTRDGSPSSGLDWERPHMTPLVAIFSVLVLFSCLRMQLTRKPTNATSNHHLLTGRRVSVFARFRSTLGPEHWSGN
jgi:hypothetical protein